jgi:hypothetical protein
MALQQLSLGRLTHSRLYPLSGLGQQRGHGTETALIPLLATELPAVE